MMENNILFLTGSITFQSEKTLKEVASIISDHLFGGLLFGGEEEYICEEVPAVFLPDFILGMQVILQGYSGYELNEGFSLTFLTVPELGRNGIDCVLDKYLESIFTSREFEKFNLQLLPNKS